MKKITSVILICTTAVVMLFSSCSKSSDSAVINDVTVSISVTQKNNNVSTVLSSGDNVFQDDSLTISVTVTGASNNNVQTVRLTSSTSATDLIPTTNVSGTSSTNTAIIVVPSTSGTITLNAYGTGQTGNNPQKANFTLKMSQMIITNYTIGCQANSSEGQFSGAMSSGTYFLSTILPNNYALDTAIDFCLITMPTPPYNKISSAASVDASLVYGTKWDTPYVALGMGAAQRITNWPVRRHTYFKLTTITNAQFTAASNSNGQIALLIKNAKAQGDPTSESIFVQDKNILLYKTTEGKYGLMQVISPTGSYNPSGRPPEATFGDAQIVSIYIY